MAEVRTVRIGPIVFEIVETMELHTDDGKRMWGEVKHGQCKILIHAGNAPQQKRQTLWHEVVHIMLTHAGRAEDSKNEELVDMIAYEVMRVLQDNPWLAEAVEDPRGLGKPQGSGKEG